nr:MAG TPA: hypothetical protein [Caudoviricetes sp.]
MSRAVIRHKSYSYFRQVSLFQESGASVPLYFIQIYEKVC